MRSDEELRWVEGLDGVFRATGSAGSYSVASDGNSGTWTLVIHSFDNGNVVPHPGIPSAERAKSDACMIDLIESANRVG